MVELQPLTNPLPDPRGKADGEQARPIPGPRSVRLATWLSVIPGLGQIYNRQPKKAAIFFFGVAALFFVTLNIPGVTAALLLWWRPRGSAMVLLSIFIEMLSLLVFMATFLLGLTFWYDAMHDARRSAQEVNGQRAPEGRWWWFHR